MKSTLYWKEGMAFGAKTDAHELLVDAKSPMGKGTGPTPKELILIGLGGCTAMDVVAMMKKNKQPIDRFEIEVDVTTSEGVQPAVFTKCEITLRLRGQVEAAKVLEAVELSQTQYCGVSAMLVKAFPISYTVELNGSLIGSGKAHFQ